MSKKEKAIILKHILLLHMVVKELSLASSIVNKGVALQKDFIPEMKDLDVLLRSSKNLLKMLKRLESHLPQIQSLLGE